MTNASALPTPASNPQAEHSRPSRFETEYSVKLLLSKFTAIESLLLPRVLHTVLFCQCRTHCEMLTYRTMCIVSAMEIWVRHLNKVTEDDWWVPPCPFPFPEDQKVWAQLIRQPAQCRVFLTEAQQTFLRGNARLRVFHLTNIFTCLEEQVKHKICCGRHARREAVNLARFYAKFNDALVKSVREKCRLHPRVPSAALGLFCFYSALALDDSGSDTEPGSDSEPLNFLCEEEKKFSDMVIRRLRKTGKFKPRAMRRMIKMLDTDATLWWGVKALEKLRVGIYCSEF